MRVLKYKCVFRQNTNVCLFNNLAIAKSSDVLAHFADIPGSSGCAERAEVLKILFSQYRMSSGLTHLVLSAMSART